jgi:hypothetical protein
LAVGFLVVGRDSDYASITVSRDLRAAFPKREEEAVPGFFKGFGRGTVCKPAVGISSLPFSSSLSYIPYSANPTNRYAGSPWPRNQRNLRRSTEFVRR